MEDTITLNELLEVMPKQTYLQLKRRGTLCIIRRAPRTLIAKNSVPEKYLSRLTSVH